MSIFFGAPRFRWGWILITIATLASFGSMLFRWSYENSYTQCQLTLDYDDTRALADAYQIPHKKLLQEFQARGVTSIGLYNQNLATLRENGRLSILTREEAEQLYPSVPWLRYRPAYRYLITATPENQSLLNQIYLHLKPQSQPSLPPFVVPTSAAQAGGRNATGQFGILVPASRQLLSDAQMGFDPAQVKAVKDLGLQITARISNPLNLNLNRLRADLDEAQATGAHVVIFSEEEVLGYSSMINVVAREMRNRDLLFGNIEFSKQRGWDDFSRETEGMLVRVHSVGGDEVAKAKVELLIDRYARSIKERNIRVAYIRLIRQAKGEYEVKPADNQPAASTTVNSAPGAPNTAAPDTNAADKWQIVTKQTALDQNLDFIAEISRELKTPPLPLPWLRPALVMGGASGFRDYPDNLLERRVGTERKAKMVRSLFLFLAGLGAVGGTLLLLNLFFDLSKGAQLGCMLAGLSIVAALSLSPGMGAKLMALQAGCVFSAIGVLWGGLPNLWDDRGSKAVSFQTSGRKQPEPVAPLRAILTGCAILCRTTLLTMIGPLLIIALLNYWKFFSGADKFLLPKATQLLPLLFVGIAFAGEVFPQRVVVEGAEPARRRALGRLNNILDHPFTARIAVVALLLFVLGSFWIARTGNDSGMEISPFELKFRALLERVFITRPRTKEIFMGHPAIMFAVWFALRRQRLLALAAVLVTTIGQADVLNTFCHIHTPLFYSLLRTFHGLWLGALAGAIALLIYAPLENWWFRRQARRDLESGGSNNGSGGKMFLQETDVATPRLFGN